MITLYFPLPTLPGEALLREEGKERKKKKKREIKKSGWFVHHLHHLERNDVCRPWRQGKKEGRKGGKKRKRHLGIFNLIEGANS